MPKLVLHPSTQTDMVAFVRRPHHAFLIYGPPGSGKKAISLHLTARLLHIAEENVSSYPHYLKISPVDGKSIPVEAIRDLQKQMKLTIPASASSEGSSISRIVVIRDAHLMSHEAQNALLKTLEEPPQNTVLILTAAGPDALLPTVLSRVRSMKVVPPPEQKLMAYFMELGYDQTAISRALMLSGGLPGLLSALVSDPTTHPLYAATEQARSLLQATAYERLAAVDALSKQKELSRDMLFILGQMARMSLLRADNMTTKNVQRWQTILKQSYLSANQLRHNANPKLVLTELMLNL